MKKSTSRRQISLWMKLILPLALVVSTLAGMTACGGGGYSSSSSTTQPAEPNVTFSSTSLTFSSQQVGSSSASQSVTLTNSGNGTLMISGISVTGSDAGDFAQTNTCGSSVAASADCTISVTFKPTATGSRTASVSVADNATGSPQTVSLAGTIGATTAVNSGAVSKAFFGMVPGFFTNLPYANLWPTVPVGTMGLVDLTQWGSIERTQGVYTWTDLDSDIQEALSNGTTSISYNVFGVPPFYTPSGSTCSDGCPGPPTDMQAFTNFITALVSRYKGQITYYDFWNEVNSPSRWTGTTAQFVSLVQLAYPIIKQIDPSAKVLAPSLAMAANFTSFLQGYLSGGGASVTDGISWHGFRCQNTACGSASCGNIAVDCAGAPLVSEIQTIQATEQAAGVADLPLYDTSGSWGQNQFLPDLTDQEAYIARWYIIQASEGVVNAAWYAWGGDPSDSTAWGSIFDANTDQTTEAATAYTTTYNWLQGSTMNGPCSADSSNVWTCALTFSNKNTGLIVWNGNETNSTYTPESKYTQYESLTSSAASAMAEDGTVTIGESPILLESGSPP